MLKALISPFMLVIAGILVYANSLSNPFIYDDQVAIVDNVNPPVVAPVLGISNNP